MEVRAEFQPSAKHAVSGRNVRRCRIYLLDEAGAVGGSAQTSVGCVAAGEYSVRDRNGPRDCRLSVHPAYRVTTYLWALAVVGRSCHQHGLSGLVVDRKFRVTRAAVAIVRYALIVAAIFCSPVYLMFCIGGHLADKAVQKRNSA